VRRRSAEHLPAGAGQPEIADQGVTGGEQAPMEAEHVDDEVRHSIAKPRRFCDAERDQVASSCLIV
jgi:hypothetical protein